jgi:hypothetical protein
VQKAAFVFEKMRDFVAQDFAKLNLPLTIRKIKATIDKNEQSKLYH